MCEPRAGYEKISLRYPPPKSSSSGGGLGRCAPTSCSISLYLCLYRMCDPRAGYEKICLRYPPPKSSSSGGGLGRFAPTSCSISLFLCLYRMCEPRAGYERSVYVTRLLNPPPREEDLVASLRHLLLLVYTCVS